MLKAVLWNTLKIKLWIFQLQAAEENPNESIDTIEKEGEKIERPRKMTLTLYAKTANKLDKAAEEHGVDPADEAVDIIEEGLGLRQAKTD